MQNEQPFRFGNHMQIRGLYASADQALVDAGIWNRASNNGCAGPRQTRRFRYYAVRAMFAAFDLAHFYNGGFGMTTKKVKLTLVGLNGNAFVLLGAFQTHAREQGWSQEEITKVLDEATSGDYNHLLRTLDAVCEKEDD